ncbi:MAG: FGGY-family carbohydrate kinase [Promethearchaeota archaeon]
MEEPELILAHDLGTSSNKAALVTPRGQVVATAASSYPLIHPAPGWAEQDPRAWWDAVVRTSREALERAGAAPSRVVALAFSGQMMGTVPVDDRGEPTTNALSWLDTRSAPQARKLVRGLVKVAGYGVVRALKWLRITGGGPNLAGKDPTSQMVWIREERPDAWVATHKFLATKGYLVFRATGEFVMTRDNAHVTWLADTRKGQVTWSPSLLKLTGIPREKLPRIVACTDVVGSLTPEAASELGLLEGTPVVGGAADIPSAAVGAGAVREGDAHLYVGTSDWIGVHASRRTASPSTATGAIWGAHPNLLLAIAEQETAGGCLEWLREHLYHGDEAARLAGLDSAHQLFDQLASKSPAGAGGVTFLPWLFGERVPVSDHAARGGFLNLSLSTRREDLVRSVLEGVALNVRWALLAVEKFLKTNLPTLKFVGGGAKSEVWCQVFADVTGKRILRVREPQHAGARGVALLASFALGRVRPFESIEQAVPVDQAFDPDASARRMYDERFRAFRSFYAKWTRKHSKQILRTRGLKFN